MMSVSSPLSKMIARWPSRDLGPVENDRSKYGTNQNRSDVYFVRGRLEPAALSEPEPQPVGLDAFTWMKSNQLHDHVGAALHPV